MMDTEAWGNISGNFPFSEAQLEKFADKLDWKEVSGNTNILWTSQMLEKFKDNWNWEELSDNSCLTPELIDRFADYINWKALINNWSCCQKFATEEFVRKYSDRIPACDFKGSCLWRELVERKEKQIKKQICLFHREEAASKGQPLYLYSTSATPWAARFLVATNILTDNG